MNPTHLEEFERRVAFSQLPRARRVLTSPFRFTSSKILEAYCTTFNACVRTRTKTFWGATMTLPIPEQVSLFLHRYRFFEEGLTRIFLQHVRPGMTVFDVGAHFGYFTLLASDLAGPTGSLHSFEPTPSTFELLRANTAGAKNIHLQNLALYRAETTVQLNDYGLAAAAFNSLRADRLDDASRRKLVAPKTYDVRATTLDAYVQSTGVRPDFIKIDAEGAEMDILAGAEQTLTTIRPMLTLEVGDFRPEISASHDTIKHLTARGYRALELRDRQLVPHGPRPSYTYDNLLFLPE